jgi:hypothetical protein
MLSVMRWFAVILLVSLSATAIAGCYSDNLGLDPRLRLSFPSLKLDSENGERVTSITVTVTCGYIVGVSRIPGDWWVKMEGPISGETTFSASAGHGASYLWKLETWNRSIEIAPYEKSCFDVSAVVMTQRGDSDEGTEHKYSQNELTLSK